MLKFIRIRLNKQASFERVAQKKLLASGSSGKKKKKHQVEMFGHIA